MRFDLKDYIIGHSLVADEEIIIGDKVGRFIPIDLETLPEIISILQSFVDDETRDTVSPCEFEDFRDDLYNSTYELLQRPENAYE